MEVVDPATLADLIKTIEDGITWICICIIVAGFLAS